MSGVGSFSQDQTPAQIPHVDYFVDPNLPGEGQRIRDQVQMGKLSPEHLASIAEKLVPQTLLRWARDVQLTPDTKRSVPRGNKDIAALIESGIFEFNKEAFHSILKNIQFRHPAISGNGSSSSFDVVEALKKSSAFVKDPTALDVVLSRGNKISDKANAQYLAELIEAGFFKDRPDLLGKIVDEIYAARESRNGISAYAESNGFWENQMRKIERPVIAALLGAGQSIRIPTGIDPNARSAFVR